MTPSYTIPLENVTVSYHNSLPLVCLQLCQSEYVEPNEQLFLYTKTHKYKAAQYIPNIGKRPTQANITDTETKKSLFIQSRKCSMNFCVSPAAVIF